MLIYLLVIKTHNFKRPKKQRKLWAKNYYIKLNKPSKWEVEQK